MTVETVRLCEVADYIRGITFKPADVVPPHSPESVVCMTTKNVQETLDESKLTAVPPRFVKRKEQYLQTGDILISSANSWNLVGKVSFVPELPYTAAAGGFISILRARRDKIDPRYLYHWMASGETQHRARLCARQTTNIANLDRERFLRLEAPLPPLPEQRRIAAILDKADAIRRKRQQTLDLADQFLRSAFLDMFGDPVTNPKRWPVKKLGACMADKPRIGTIAKASDDGSIPVVRVKDLGQHSLPNSLTTTVDLKQADIDRFQIVAGDFLLARAIGSEDHLGKASVVRGDSALSRNFAVFDSHVMRLRFDEAALHPDFFWQWMKTSGGRALFMQNAGRTAVQFNINATQIARIAIALPPEGLQAQFVQIAQNVKKLREILNGALDKCSELSRTLTQRAFRAEL